MSLMQMGEPYTSISHLTNSSKKDEVGFAAIVPAVNSEPHQPASFSGESKQWASFETDDEERLGLVNGSRDLQHKEWINYTKEKAGSDSSRSSNSSSEDSEDPHSELSSSSEENAEEEDAEDIWTITEEQKEYYTNQFRSMQADINGAISGQMAKEFFVKSKLPVPELSKIWSLSDVNCDGALSLAEFCTAMHLVVLRKNEIELPDQLPPQLQPYTPLIDFSGDESEQPEKQPIEESEWPTAQTSDQPGHEWATFSDHESSVSSPTLKLSNFDFRPVQADAESNIVHPIALRMSPDGQPLSPLHHQSIKTRTASDPVQYDPGEVPPATKARAGTTMEGRKGHPSPPKGLPRPLPKMAVARAAFLPTIPPPPAHLEDNKIPSSAKKEPPPPPPPRPKQHVRSSSLDLNRSVFRPPALPPRILSPEVERNPATHPGQEMVRIHPSSQALLQHKFAAFGHHVLPHEEKSLELVNDELEDGITGSSLVQQTIDRVEELRCSKNREDLVKAIDLCEERIDGLEKLAETTRHKLQQVKDNRSLLETRLSQLMTKPI